MELTSSQIQQITSLLRSIMSYAIGRLVGAHIIDSQLGDEIVGVVAMLAPVAWSYFERKYFSKKTDAKIVDAVNVGVTITDPRAPLLSPTDAKQAMSDVAPVIEANKGDGK